MYIRVPSHLIAKIDLTKTILIYDTTLKYVTKTQ